MSRRPTREVAVEGRPLLLIDAWRAADGLGLGYFAALAPPPEGSHGGAGDRRVALDPGVEIAGLDDDEIADLYAGAAPLTDTERRFTGPDGELWLAQSTGPVWGEGAAAGTLGIQLRCLTGERPAVRARRLLEELDDRALAEIVSPDIEP